MGFNHEVLYLTNSRWPATRYGRFHRPSTGITQINRVNLLTWLQLYITDLKYGAYNAGLLRTK
jgi:hypothetical protein